MPSAAALTPIAVRQMGIASALGAELSSTWEHLERGASGVSFLPGFAHRGRELPVGRCSTEALGQALRRAGRTFQEDEPRVLSLSECVAAQALSAERARPECLGLYLGSSLTTSDFVAEQYTRYFAGKRPSPSVLIEGMSCYIASEIARRFGIEGPVQTVSTSCTSSLQALLAAARDLRLGHVDQALVIGVDSCFAPGILDSWVSARVLSFLAPPESACRPFCATRRGLVYAEGAAAVLLTRATGAEGELQILGGAVRHDPKSHLLVSRDALVSCMRAALGESAVDAGDLDLVQASAAGSPHVDQIEAQALAQLIPREIPVQAAKSFTGSALGAAGLINVVFTLLAMRERALPANINVFEKDSEIEPLIQCYYSARELPSSSVALVNCFGFGGTNASVVVARR
ncbi:MAG: hypothetical protein HY901_22030 [Deltaproteobacteria bacterium]|nr:hypothetical protein [Deltaproteobacteria bacterium]